MRYERVRFQGRTALLRVENETAKFLTGIEVKPDGDPVTPRGADERRHIIEKTEISQRTPCKMNHHYGRIEDHG